jgi:hypothetical protein
MTAEADAVAFRDEKSRCAENAYRGVLYVRRCTPEDRGFAVFLIPMIRKGMGPSMS